MKVGTREKRFIIIGLVIVAALAIVYALTVQPEDGTGITDTVEIKKRTLLTQKEKLYLEGVYESRLQLYNSRLQEDKARLLEGETRSVAEGKLLNALMDFANGAGVQITSSPRPEKKVEDRLIKVTYRIDTNCTMDQFVRLLTEIANYEKFLTVDELSVTSASRGRPPANRGRSGIQAPNTNITPRLTVSGYILSNEAEKEENSPDTNL